MPPEVLALLVKAQQLSLFDDLVQVPTSVKKDGTVVHAYTRVQKKARKPPPAHREPADIKPPPFVPKHTEAEMMARHAENNAALREKAKAHREHGYPEPQNDRPVIKDHPYLTGKPRPKQDPKPLELAADRAPPVQQDAPAKPRAPTPEGTAPPKAKVVAQFGAAGESAAERRRINAEVIALIKDGGEYGPADKALLARYSGNGGCGDSLNEFYTDPAVASAMWSVIHRLGIENGVALEPSCGAGVFLHTAPEHVHVIGVEMDPISAKVASVLHGDRHEIRTSSMERFATSDERQFDAVIGNAPFGIRGSTIKDDKPDVTRADTYFIDTALDKIRAGGIVAMIVHHGVLDSARDRAMRKEFLTKGEFLGALRMPNTAFEHSQTDVTADILFFRKRPQDVANALGTLNEGQLRELRVWDDEFVNGSYFDGRGKVNILGTVEPGWRAKAGMGNDITVAGSMQGVPEHIAQWTPDDFTTARPDVPTILQLLKDDPRARARAAGAAIRRPYELTKPGSIKTVDGVQYILEGKPPRWHRVDEVMDRPAVTAADDIANRIDALVNGGDVDRAALAADVKAYVAAHGVPGKNHDLVTAAHQDRVYYRLIGAVNNDGTLSELLTKDPEGDHRSSFELAAQTLAVEHANGQFSPQDVAARTGQSLEDVEDLLHASSAYAYVGGEWTTMEHYLTGELWPKLDAVKAALARPDIDPGIRAKYELQAKKLDETIDPKSLEDVDLQVNYAFIPPEVVAAYFTERKNESDNDWIRKQDDVSIRFAEGVYTVSGGEYRTRDLLERYLNRSGVEKDEWDDIVKMNKDFKDWLTASRYRDQIETLYNRKFRGYVAPQFSNAPIDIPGMNTEGLKEYQYGGTRWALAHGKGIIAADVGLGKTVRALMIARLMKLEGKAKRNMIVVPKSVVANWAAEAQKWFPGTKVLTIGETVDGEKSRADTAAERNQKLHQYMQNDYDFVFISQPAFNDLDVDPITKKRYSDDDFWIQRGEKLGNAGDKKRKAIKENYEQAMARRDFDKRTDALYFNDLGVDMLMADEAHAYKNLYGVRNRFGQSPKFLGGGGLSKQSQDMLMKARSVRDAHDGKGVFFLTATPTKNSPLEIYSMLSHIAPEEFDKLGIRNSEEFLDRFCEFATGPCLQTDGTIEDSLYVSGFKNMDELRTTMKRFIDRTTADDVGLVLPKRDDRMHMVDMSPAQASVYESLRELAHKSAANKDKDGDSHIFSIMDKMGKAAMDLEVLDPQLYADEPSPKYDALAANVAETVKDGGQIVFCETLQSHEKIKAALVAKGIPAKEIAIFNAQTAKTGDARQKIADAFNAGKFKVVIGNKTMEQGVNLQKGTADIHHMDIAWEPATMQQRNGRGLRQGNKKASVRIHSYLAKGSFDGYRYQAMAAKKSWQDLLWRGGDKVENLERPTMTRDEMMVMMSADPDAARKQMEENREFAKAKYVAVKTAAASDEFMRFQSLKTNFAKLKNKDSDAAQRLRIRVAAAKSKLEGNKYFKAKSALDSDTLVLLHPQTGIPLSHGAGLEVDGKKWVVTSVNPIERSVNLRSYGNVGKGLDITLPLDKMGDDVKPYEYSEADETAEVSKQFADKAADPDAVLDMAALRGFPAGVVHANYAGIQARMKRGLAEYKIHAGHGERVPYLHEGKAKTAASYEASKLPEGAELMLPTEEHRARAIQEYIAAEQGKELRHEDTASRSRSRHVSHTARLVAKYRDGDRDYASEASNPWKDAGKFVFGDGFEKEAHGAFMAHQMQHVKEAPTFREMLSRAAPTLKLDYSGHEWPQEALAALHARAKADGILEQPLQDHVPKKQTYGYMADAIDRHVWQSKHKYRPNQVTDVRQRPIQHALTQIAKDHGYNGLAAAMHVSGGQTPAHALQDIMQLPLNDDHVIAAIAHLAERHPDLGAQPIKNFANSWELQRIVGHGNENATVAQLADILRLHASTPPTATEAA